jgi:hypothetical protein
VSSVGKFLLAKEQNAIVVAFIAALLPMFYIPTGFIAVIIVALVTLQRGAKAGFWVLSWVALPTIAMLALRRLGLFDLLIARCVLIWFFAAMIHHYRTWNALLSAVTFTGVIAVVALHFFVPTLEQWWTVQLTAYMQHFLSESRWHFQVTPAEFAASLAPMATGLIVFFIACTLFIEVLIARYWQTLIFRPGTFGEEFTQIRAGRLVAMLPLVVVLLILAKVNLAIDMAPLAIFPLFIAGLSLFHYWARQKKQLIFLLVLIYAGLFVLPALVVAIVALIAFIDTWVHFRKRKKVVVP